MSSSVALDCPWCGKWGRLEIVQGHYQCRNCKKPVMDCCDGETADELDWENLSSKISG